MSTQGMPIHVDAGTVTIAYRFLWMKKIVSIVHRSPLISRVIDSVIPSLSDLNYLDRMALH